MEQKTTYAGLVVAAGLSKRMGEFKPLLPLNGKTMIESTVDSMLQAAVPTVVVVAGYRGGEIEAVFAQKGDPRIQVVHNPNYRHGDMMESVRTGIGRLADAAAAFILPGDIPLVGKNTFKLLQAEMETGRCKVAVPTLNGRPKHPPLVHQSCFDALLSFRQDGGLQVALQLFREQTILVPVDDLGCSLDADTPAQYRDLLLFSAAKKQSGGH